MNPRNPNYHFCSLPTTPKLIWLQKLGSILPFIHLEKVKKTLTINIFQQTSNIWRPSIRVDNFDAGDVMTKKKRLLRLTQVSFEQVCLLSTLTLHILDILMLIKHGNELGMGAKDMNVIF